MDRNKLPDYPYDSAMKTFPKVMKNQPDGLLRLNLKHGWEFSTIPNVFFDTEAEAWDFYRKNLDPNSGTLIDTN